MFILKPLETIGATKTVTETWMSTPSELDDSLISSQSLSTNYSTSQYLVTGKHSSFATTRTFLNFKLPILPKDAIITSVKLSLYQYYNTTNQVTVDIRPITGSWSVSS